MPDRFARHARTKWEWSVGGGRKNLQDKAVQDDPAKKSPPAKKKRGECKQNHWGPHEFEIVIDTKMPQFPSQRRLGVMVCKWSAEWSWRNGDGRYKPRWACWHAEVCKHCGTVRRDNWSLKPEECPNFVAEIPVEVLAEARRKQEHHDSLPRRTWRRKPPPDGPQGYRKPKSV